MCGEDVDMAPDIAAAAELAHIDHQPLMLEVPDFGPEGPLLAGPILDMAELGLELHPLAVDAVMPAVADLELQPLALDLIPIAVEPVFPIPNNIAEELLRVPAGTILVGLPLLPCMLIGF